MPELPIELRKLQPVKGALELIRYLDQLPDGAADSDDIMEDVGLSERAFGKVTRRLVTTGYIQMRSDYVYELTSLGQDAAQTLAEYDEAGGGGGTDDGIKRQLVVALPRNLVAGQTSTMKIGFAPEASMSDSDVVLRLEMTYADVGEMDEMIQLGGDAFIMETTIAPQQYDQARLKLQVFQLSPGGDDLNVAGGLYVDVAVLKEGDTGEMIAYSTDLSFK